MIPRYTRPEMGRIWTDESRYNLWFDIELLAAEAMVAEGLVPIEAVTSLTNRRWTLNSEDVAEIAAIETEVRHDVIAFLTFLERRLGPEARYLHLGMTSSDVLDTALAVQLCRASDELERDLAELLESLREQAEKHRHSAMVGRTHGMHAEPTTFGLVLALWWAEFSRQRRRLSRAREEVAVGKLSGAVGTFAHLPLSVEEFVCRRLGLTPEPIANQVVQRDRHAAFFCCLANLGASIEKVAVNLRHLQRTEVGEVAEAFARGQRGSSAMPHKQNPIGLENLTGVARLLRAYAGSSLEDVALWHERDISHSVVERVIGPDATILCDYALHRLTGIVRGLQVRTDRMRQNMERTGGLIYSGAVLLALVRSGLSREAAYGLVQRNAMVAGDSGRSLRDLLQQDVEVLAALGPEGIARCFEPEASLERVDAIFERVFTRGDSKAD